MTTLGNVHHVAVAFENGGPQFKQYPPGSCFDCTMIRVECRYDHSSGGIVLTQVMRVTGVRGPDGEAIPFPSNPAGERNEQRARSER